MKQFKLSFLLFVLMSMLGNKAWADGSCGDGVVWSLSGTDLTITYTGSGTGKMTDYESYTKPWGSNITSVVIGDGVTSIGDWAFSYCTGLTSIEIPNSVTSIGRSAFGCCSGMTSITVESGNTVYDSRNNCNAIIETSSNTLITGCKATVIPSSVTSIGLSAFAYCTGLTSIEIPNSVTSIGAWAFDGCSSLTSIEIPNSVTSIVLGTFQNCTGLTSIKIPNSVTSIGKSAFDSCI